MFRWAGLIFIYIGRVLTGAGGFEVAKAFSVLSWNVENVGNNTPRLTNIVVRIKERDPDVFALLEVSGSQVWRTLFREFPDHNFQITEGPQSQEILLGVRKNLHSFITQRTEFNSRDIYMRPGQLLTIQMDGQEYCLLFLHLASMRDPRGFGLRDDMFEKAFKLRSDLDAAAGGKHQSNYIFLGDLNTMGMEYPWYDDIEQETELKKWDNRATRSWGMTRLCKTYEMTWWNRLGGDPESSNLDHVYAAKHLVFKQFKDPAGVNRDVLVTGWVDEDPADRDTWKAQNSDHSMLYFEVQKV